MKTKIAKYVVFYCFLLAMNSSYADTLSSPVTSTKPEVTAPVSDNNSLLSYLNQVLTDAGFTDATRKYLVDSANPQIQAIHARDFADKNRLLKRNLYIFLKDLSEKHRTPITSEVIQNAYSRAELDSDPWNYVLSKDVLASFKANHVFDEVTVNDITDANKKFCPIWPFCNDN